MINNNNNNNNDNNDNEEELNYNNNEQYLQFNRRNNIFYNLLNNSALTEVERFENLNNELRELNQRFSNRHNQTLMNELIENRCHYINSDNNFCRNVRLLNSNYCNLHQSSNNINPFMPIREIPRENLNISQELDISQELSIIPELDISQDLFIPEIDISRELELDISQQQEINNFFSEEDLSITGIPILRRNRVLPINITMAPIRNNQDSDSEIESLLNLIPEPPRRRRRRGYNPIFIPSRVRFELQEEDNETRLCLLCENYIEGPNIHLECKHRYHLNCFIIDNSNENGFDIKKSCSKCQKEINYDLKEYDCSICLEKIIDHKILFDLPCKHKFHLHCIEQWRNMNKNTCPLCRTHF